MYGGDTGIVVLSQTKGQKGHWQSAAAFCNAAAFDFLQTAANQSLSALANLPRSALANLPLSAADSHAITSRCAGADLELCSRVPDDSSLSCR